MTPRYHGTTQKLNVALELAKKAMRVKKECKSHPTIDDLAAMAQMILLEVEEREINNVSSSDQQWALETIIEDLENKISCYKRENKHLRNLIQRKLSS